MQFPRRLLLLLFASILLTIIGLIPLAKPVNSYPFGVLQQKAADENDSPPSNQLEAFHSIHDRKHFHEISRVLSMIETGEKTLNLIEKYDVRVGFERGRGSRFLPSQNEIIIDTRHGYFSAAIILVHEAMHARYIHEGLAADITVDDRHAYVQKKIDEEIQAMAASIEATSELREAGVDIANLRPFLYYAYKQAYGSAFRAAKHDYPGMEDEDLRNIGRTAGQKAILEGVLDGQIVTSINQQTYLEYWGSIWDAKRGL